MAVSELRSCYKTKCRFFQNDPRESDIQWYFVDEDTPDLPFGTIFSPNVWLDQPEGTQELGEVPGAERIWVNGVEPFPAAGVAPCGTAEQFAFGDPDPPDPPTPLNVYGGPSCCALPDPPFLHFDCVNCPNGAWSHYSLESPPISPTSWIAGLPTMQTQEYVGSCTWDFTLIELLNWPGGPKLGKWIFVVRPDRILAGVYILNDPTFHFFFDSLVPWSCRTVEVLPRNAAGITAGVPTSITILPGIASGVGRLCPAWGVFVPDNLMVRIRPAGAGIVDIVQAQDLPLTRAGPNTWRGDMLWLFRVPLLPIIAATITTPCALTAGVDGSMTLAFTSPHGAAGTYAADLFPWDLSPKALMLAPGGPWPASLPQAVTLYVFSDLPP